MSEVGVRGLVEAVRERAGSDDPLVLLETAVLMAGETNQAADGLVEHYVGAARAAGLSWTLIGERLGVSRQAARQKYAPAGGQRPDRGCRRVDCDGTAFGGLPASRQSGRRRR